MIVRSERKRINQVITNARMYLYMQPWTPLRDEHAFKSANPAHTFHSAFRIAAGKQLDATCSARYYEVMPYVFGGSDSITKFQNRIYNRTCPGGWDRISANTTSHWYSGLGYGARVPGNLAGIDCSAYVSNCWQITRRTTRTLPNICLGINKNNLKTGDILNRRGRHVRIFNRWVGRQIDVYEATGGAARREFRPGDEFGRVVHHTIAWDEKYTPYSPFPQFEVVEPTTCPVFDARPTFKIQVKGSGTLELCEFIFDGVSIVPKMTRNSTRRIMDLTYTPNYDLMPGKYSLLIEATNRVARQSFKDELSLQFQIQFA